MVVRPPGGEIGSGAGALAFGRDGPTGGAGQPYGA